MKLAVLTWAAALMYLNLTSCAEAPNHGESVQSALREAASTNQWVLPAVKAYSGEISKQDLGMLLTRGFSPAIEFESQIKLPTQEKFGDLLSHRLHVVFRDMQALFDVHGVPEPQLIIVDTAVPNAFVTAIQACVPGTITINGGNNGLPKPFLELTNMLESSLKLGFGFESPGTVIPTPACLNVANLGGGQAGLQESLEREILFNGQPCFVNRQENAIDFSCPKEKSTSVLAKDLRWSLEAPYIFVFVGALASFHSWDELDALLAHELGHYLRMHSLHLQDYGYFYDKNNQEAYLPERSVDLDALGDAISKLRKKYSLQYQPLKAGPGFEDFYHSSGSLELLERTADALFKKLNEPDGSQKDFSFDKAMCSPFIGASSILGEFFSLRAPQFDKNDARKFLSGIRDCFQSIQLKSKTAESYLKNFFDDSDLPLIFYFDKTAGSQLVSSLWDTFITVDNLVSKGVRSLVRSPALRRLGFYTFEEEADVFAVNYLKARNLDISIAQKMIIDLMETSASLDSKMSENMKVCLAAYQRGWRSLRGPRIPVMDDENDPHHAFCYRLYNFERITKLLIPVPPLATRPEAETVPYDSVRAFYGEELKRCLSEYGG